MMEANDTTQILWQNESRSVPQHLRQLLTIGTVLHKMQFRGNQRRELVDRICSKRWKGRPNGDGGEGASGDRETKAVNHPLFLIPAEQRNEKKGLGKESTVCQREDFWCQRVISREGHDGGPMDAEASIHARELLVDSRSGHRKGELAQQATRRGYDQEKGCGGEDGGDRRLLPYALVVVRRHSASRDAQN
jgi:hypothetical protein